MRIVFDIEANSLLDDSSVDYTASPYVLKDSFVVWCIAAMDIDTGDIYTFVGDEVKTKFPSFICKATTIIAHNGINYDFMVLKTYLGLDFEIEPDLFNGQPVEIIDTLVFSKTLNPDRPKGHSLEEWGKFLGNNKIDWRERCIQLGVIQANAPKGAEFWQWHPEMLDYCIQDVRVTKDVYGYLLQEAGDWPWAESISLEKKVAYIITMQSHRGFYFQKEKAEAAVRDLDAKIEELRQRVEPHLPMKQLAKTALAQLTPPKGQFTKAGKLHAHLIGFVEKHNGTLDEANRKVVLYGKEYDLPLPVEPLYTEVKASLSDTTLIKEWLMSKYGWQPTNYKEKDLSVDSKKRKLDEDKYLAAVERYVAQTLASPFCEDRCEHLKTTPAQLKNKLLSAKKGRAVKVLTNPTFTVGQDKELCPNLELLQDKFPFAMDLVHYLTYMHRRNSILGGGVDVDDADEEAEKGYLSYIRSDGRVATPADTCGAATSRFKHRQVANIPRTTSLYGKEMRDLFSVGEGFVQLGYDFDALEAKEEAHFCWRYDNNDKSYCHSLTAEKPNDVHTVTSRKIANMIKKDFSRGNAKSVKYGASYGAREPKIAKIIGEPLDIGTMVFNGFWEAAFPLAKFKDAITTYWETKGEKKFILGLDKRKVPTRSPHALVNSCFQSAGVICAKRAMVIHYDLLKERGYIVDFFKDDWKNMLFVQQLIAYHKYCGLVW